MICKVHTSFQVIDSSGFPKAGVVGDKQEVVLGCHDSVMVLKGMPRVSGMEGAWAGPAAGEAFSEE